MLARLHAMAVSPSAATPPICPEPASADAACLGPAEANAQLSGILLKVVENKPGLHHLLVSLAWGTSGLRVLQAGHNCMDLYQTCMLAPVNSAHAA